MYTVLALICHPDDMEIHCGGTLLKCKDRGDRVVVCNLCNGNLGHMEIMPDELRNVRNLEAEASCNIGGFEHYTCDFGDLDIYHNNKEARDKVVEIIRKVDPDFIITHFPEDYMADHVETSKLVFDASFAATVPHYAPEIPGKARVVPIYYMSPSNGLNFCPDEYVDISDCIDTKLKMLSCHKSQVVWLKEHDGIDICEDARAISRFWGLQCGVKYAEGFRRCNVALKIPTKRLLP